MEKTQSQQSESERGGNADTEIEYPYAHPKGKEIAEIKKEINVWHNSASEALANARLSYAEKDWSKMGAQLKEVMEYNRKVGVGLESLQTIIESPLI